jgi:hypothetical protein
MISYLKYELSKKLRPTQEQIQEKKQKIRERLEKIKESTPALYNKKGLYQNDSNNELMARRGIPLSEAYYAAPDRNQLRATQPWTPFDSVKNARKRRSKKRKMSNRPTKNVKHKKETPTKS